MLIYIVRHGETDWNRQRRLQGQTDIPLNEKGIKLAEITGEALSQIPFDICFTSPLVRAVQTADAILKQNDGYLQRAKAVFQNDPAWERRILLTESGLPVIPDRRIMELDFGSWEGLGCGADNYEIPVPEFDRFFTDPAHFLLSQDGEQLDDLKRRTHEFLQRLSAREELENKIVLLTTHGCAMRALLNPFYKDPEQFWQSHVPYNCETAVIEVENNGTMRLTEPGKIFYDAKLAANYRDADAKAHS